MSKSAKNRRELNLEDRGAIHLLNRAAKYLTKECYTPLGMNRYDGCRMGEWQPETAEEAKDILASCSAAVFHGGEPKQAKKPHWSEAIDSFCGER